MESRNFQLDTEWSMLHYPDKPSGFGILIIGDERHFVDRSSSFWTQNEGKAAILELLKAKGYTVFYSNLYGRHWGSDRAVQHAKDLYAHILKNEIINEKIHVLAEGMGALIAIKLLEEMSDQVRSACYINPILSLSSHLEQEKEHKFFYKKLTKELAYAYGTDQINIMETAKQNEKNLADFGQIPAKIIHILSGGRSYKQSAFLKQLSIQWENQGAPISVYYTVPEKQQAIGTQIVNFFQMHEKNL